MDWNLAHLTTLAAVVRYGSFSRAALALRLTQPAISMQVRQLEDAVGIPLLERTGRHVAATAAGELVLEHTRRVMRELETATERLQALRGTVAGRVRIGTTEAMSSYLMPSILARLRSRHPELEIRLMTGAARESGRPW